MQCVQEFLQHLVLCHPQNTLILLLNYCEAQARVRQGSARDGSQGERPQSLNPCQELTLKLVATFPPPPPPTHHPPKSLLIFHQLIKSNHRLTNNNKNKKFQPCVYMCTVIDVFTLSYSLGIKGRL